MTLRMSPPRVASLHCWSLFTALVLGSVPVPALAQAVRPDAQATNGVIRSSALFGNTLYVGGDFTWVGYPTGPSALVDRSTAPPNMTFPVVARTEIVNVAIPDGSGGWY